MLSLPEFCHLSRVPQQDFHGESRTAVVFFSSQIISFFFVLYLLHHAIFELQTLQITET
jgi:hypothetical protein